MSTYKHTHKYILKCTHTNNRTSPSLSERQRSWAVHCLYPLGALRMARKWQRCVLLSLAYYCFSMSRLPLVLACVCALCTHVFVCVYTSSFGQGQYHLLPVSEIILQACPCALCVCVCVRCPLQCLLLSAHFVLSAVVHVEMHCFQLPISFLTLSVCVCVSCPQSLLLSHILSSVQLRT
jgi:hypothetical protein